MLGCIVVFINSCNSLISVKFGTHKLRSTTMAEIEQNGLGDADFVEITDAHLPGKFIHAPGTKKEDGGLIIYPILSESQFQEFEAGKKAKTPVMAWTDTFEWDCLKEKNCAPKGKTNLKGVIRAIFPEKDKSSEFSNEFQLASPPVFMEVGRAPTAWYIHLLFMLLTAGSVLAIEVWRLKRGKINE